MEKLQTGQVLECEVSGFGMNGEGVVKIDGYPIFVPFAVEGENVKIKITYAKKDFAFADLIEVLSPSNDRIKPVCPYFTRCGGCDLQHLTYKKQLEIKQANISGTLKKICGIDIAVPIPVSVNEWAYRNKLALPFGKTKSGKTALGFYEKKSHSVVPMKWCPLHGDWASALIAAVCEWADENDISVYDELSGKGLMRHLVARKLDDLSLTFVVNGNKLPNLNKLTDKLDAAFCKDGYTVYLSVNKNPGNAIMGENVKLLYGTPRKQNLGAFNAEVSPMSFLQVNDKAREALYAAVSDCLHSESGDILELYSGVGLLTAQLAVKLPASKITAVEIIPEATADADALMKSLAIESRVNNVTSDAADFIKSAICKKKSDGDLKTSCGFESDADETKINTVSGLCGKFDVNDSERNMTQAGTENKNINDYSAVILDPPRKGCDREIIDSIVESGIPKIVYISCNPATLARDIKIFFENGYSLSYLQPFEMFPQTSHIEILLVLNKG